LGAQGEQELKSSAEDGWEQQQAWVVQVEAHVDDVMKVLVVHFLEL